MEFNQGLCHLRQTLWLNVCLLKHARVFYQQMRYQTKPQKNCYFFFHSREQRQEQITRTFHHLCFPNQTWQRCTPVIPLLLFIHKLNQGTLSLILKGEASEQWTSSSLPVRTRLFWKWKKNFSLSWNSWFLTSKYKEVNRIDTSPFRIKVSVPCLNHRGPERLNRFGIRLL